MRVTVEFVHVVRNWFDPEKELVSTQGKHLIVLSGKHADVENIDDEHKFIKTERFWVAGKPVVHEAGKHTMLMYNLIELRKSEASVREMLEQVHVMQQPSGYVDQVIMKWHLVRQGEQFPLSIAVRDLFTGAYCDASRLTMSTISQVPSWIWGKMTPVCQFTDTTAVFPFKRFFAR